MDTPTGFKSNWRLASGVLSCVSDKLRRQCGVRVSNRNATQPFNTRAAGALLESAQLGLIALELDMDMQEVLDPRSDIERDWSIVTDGFLTSANDLIDDKILHREKAAAQQSKPKPGDPPGSVRDYAKLYALLDPHLHSAKGMSSDLDDDSSEDWVMVLDDERRSIFFEQANELYEKVRSGCSDSIARSEVEIQKQDLTDKVDDVKLSQAEAISQSVEELHRRICEGLKSCCCEGGHLCQTKLYLSDFSQIRLDLMLDHSENWYSTICTKQRYQQSNMRAISLCQTLRDQCAYDETAHFTFGNQGLRKVPFKDASRLDVATKHTPIGMDLNGFINQRSDWEKLERADKRKLLAIIARALLFLYRSPWWEHSELLDYVSFNRDTVSSLPNHLSPHILGRFGQPQSAKHPPDAMVDQHPIFLQYGLLLVEFEYGKSLGVGQGTRCEEPEESYLILERQLGDSRIRRSVSEACRHIAKACLDFDKHLTHFEQMGLSNCGNLKFRAVIYKLILKPLLQEIRKDFPNESLDGLDIPDWSIETSMGTAKVDHRYRKTPVEHTCSIDRPARLLPRTPSSGHMPEKPSNLHYHSSSAKTEDYRRQLDRRSGFPHPQSHIAARRLPQGLLFDGATAESNDDIYSAEKFFHLHNQFFREKIRRKEAQSRVRVAILDTGLNLENVEENFELQGILRKESLGNPIRKIASFTGTPERDDHGHGTHCAELLLKVAPHVELFIAKIADNDILDDHGLERASQALKWAINEKVDIISMSFGFPERCYGYDNLAHHIQIAYANNIILFAAASNQGANGTRSYPAKDPHVICIHAFDGMGKDVRSFNPLPLPNEYNFATLGIGIQCSWNGVACYKSGTSFATPVAAGIAANSLQYAKFHTEEGRLSRQDKIYERLRTVAGMRKMFELMTAHRDQYQWVCPWKFWKSEENDQDHCRDLERNLIDVTLF